MELKKLIHTLDVLEVVGTDDVKIAGIQSDSRKVEDGFLFVAVRGTAVDGHAYIDGAIAKGAVAVVCEGNSIPFGRKWKSFREKCHFHPGEGFGGCIG